MQTVEENNKKLFELFTELKNCIGEDEGLFSVCVDAPNKTVKNLKLFKRCFKVVTQICADISGFIGLGEELESSGTDKDGPRSAMGSMLDTLVTSVTNFESMAKLLDTSIKGFDFQESLPPLVETNMNASFLETESLSRSLYRVPVISKHLSHELDLQRKVTKTIEFSSTPASPPPRQVVEAKPKRKLKKHATSYDVVSEKIILLQDEFSVLLEDYIQEVEKKFSQAKAESKKIQEREVILSNFESNRSMMLRKIDKSVMTTEAKTLVSSGIFRIPSSASADHELSKFLSPVDLFCKKLAISIEVKSLPDNLTEARQTTIICNRTRETFLAIQFKKGLVMVEEGAEIFATNPDQSKPKK